MKKQEGKLMDLFRAWAENVVAELKPDARYATVEELSTFDAAVRKTMAAEFRAVRKFVNAKRPSKELRTVEVVTPREVLEIKVPTDVVVRTRAGMQELHKLRWHRAFRRIAACAQCVSDAKKYKRKEPLMCRHHTPMQDFIFRMYDVLSKKPDTRKLMYVLLVLREAVEHHFFYGFNPVTERKFTDTRKRAESRESFSIEKLVWKDDTTLESTEYTEVMPTDSTSRLYADLQSWDRPSSFSKKTQRLAFCGTCAERGDSPWFWTPRKRINGEYEKAPFALTAVCRRCGQVEVQPDLPPRTPVQFVPRKYRRHGIVGYTINVLYRSRGRWVAAATHEACCVMLSNRLQQRWRNTGR